MCFLDEYIITACIIRFTYCSFPYIIHRTTILEGVQKNKEICYESHTVEFRGCWAGLKALGFSQIERACKNKSHIVRT